MFELSRFIVYSLIILILLFNLLPYLMLVIQTADEFLTFFEQAWVSIKLHSSFIHGLFFIHNEFRRVPLLEAYLQVFENRTVHWLPWWLMWFLRRLKCQLGSAADNSIKCYRCVIILRLVYGLELVQKQQTSVRGSFGTLEVKLVYRLRVVMLFFVADAEDGLQHWGKLLLCVLVWCFLHLNSRGCHIEQMEVLNAVGKLHRIENSNVFDSVLLG